MLLISTFRPVTSGVRSIFFGPSTIQSLRSEGRDSLFPADCGRDEQNKGKLCFGDPELCKVSKYKNNTNKHKKKPKYHPGRPVSKVKISFY